jgi:single-strand DNA-binding protein
MQDTNSITLVGRLTRDPELRSTVSGLSVCSLRLAYTQARKNGDQWVEDTGYIDVSVWGPQGENVAKFLAKGRQVVVLGRLDFKTWQDKEGKNRDSYQIVANSVQFVGGNDGAPVQSNPVAQQSNPNNAPADDDEAPF